MHSARPVIRTATRLLLMLALAVALDYSVGSALANMGLKLGPALSSSTFFTLTISQVAPILPYLFLVLILIFRPKGLLGTREG